MYKHFIRLDGSKIIKGFSTAFEQPLKGDILIAENTDERHFILNDKINPPLTNEQGIVLYKYEKGKVVARTKTEIDADTALISASEPSEMEKLRVEVDAVKAILVTKEVITEAEKEALKEPTLSK